MGIFSDLCSAISEAIKPIASAISSVLQNSPLMQKLMPVLAVAIPPPFDVVAVVALEVIAAALGKPENPDELGWQMNQADKTPEDFDSFDEYKEFLDREYPFDRAAFDAQTDEEKSACRYAGMAGTIEELKQAKGFELNANALGVLAGAASALGWGRDTIKSFTSGMLNTIGGAGLVSFNALADYAKGGVDQSVGGIIDKAISAGIKLSGISDAVDVVKTAMQTVATSVENA